MNIHKSVEYLLISGSTDIPQYVTKMVCCPGMDFHFDRWAEPNILFCIFAGAMADAYVRPQNIFVILDILIPTQRIQLP